MKDKQNIKKAINKNNPKASGQGKWDELIKESERLAEESRRLAEESIRMGNEVMKQARVFIDRANEQSIIRKFVASFFEDEAALEAFQRAYIQETEKVTAGKTPGEIELLYTYNHPGLPLYPKSTPVTYSIVAVTKSGKPVIVPEEEWRHRLREFMIEKGSEWTRINEPSERLN